MRKYVKKFSRGKEKCVIMKKMKSIFRKNGIGKRIFGVVMALAMIVTMFADVPGNFVTAKAAEGATNITVHFDNSTWSWGEPALQFWGGTDTDTSGHASGPTQINGWSAGDMGYTLTAESDGWYSMTLTGDFTGFQFLDMSNPSNNTAGKGYSSYMTQYNGDTPQDLYYKPDTGVWYTDKACTTELTKPADAVTYDVTLHWYNADNWSTVNAWVWNNDGNLTGGEWPGKTLTENTEKNNWYDISFTNLNYSKLEFIYNNGSAQTDDLSVELTTDTTDVWVTGGKSSPTISTTAPELWINPPADGGLGDTTTYDVTLHFYNSDKWDTVAAWVWDDANNNYSGGSWPGTVLSQNANKSNWYDLSLSGITSSNLSFIFNNNNNGQQTNDLSATLSADTTEIWVTGGDKSSADPGTVYTSAPELWTNPDAVTEDTAHSIYYAKDSMAVKIGSTTYPMSVYANGVFKCTVDLAVGNYTATVIKNGVESDVTASISVTDATKKTEISLDNDVLTAASAEDAAVDPYISFIGDAREAGDDNWSTGVKGYEFTQLSDTLYRYEKTFTNAGTYSYKAVFNYSTWYEKEGSGNRMLNLTKDNTHVVFLYDTTTGYLYDTENNEARVASLLSMKVRPAEMEVIDNANGTTTFAAVAESGQEVYLYYGNKADVEANGTSALTKVKMGAVKNGKSTSDELWLGDAALDIVFYYDIAGTRTLDENKTTVTVGGADYSNYTRAAYTGRVVNLPGSFPGKSWDSSSNLMSYKGNRIYYITFKDLPAATYEYKVAHDGSWAENYGPNGELNSSSNCTVSVPKLQDVTIYYSDLTHLTVNSIDYKFATITLSGTNIPAGTQLTDEGLTGIYTATVVLPAGTYSDLVLNCDGKEYKFASFTTEEEKTVTFCMDPVTGLFYHNASDVPIEEDAIYFDSKDEAYKSVYGAVATDEEVTFSITTGTDITSASLLIKGKENKAVEMSKAGEAVDGKQKWSATTSLSMLGEYSYYFAVSNGASVKVYGDDDGYYGTGKVSDLTEVKPYDLVVYQSGFETPDWMKNAVIYQIFPDRFFDGDESNNDNQTTARGAVDYEYITDWYTLPENPEQEGLLDEATYKSTGAYYGDGQWSNEIYGGDLEGITERIDYLEALGVTVIYLNPVFSSISNHRYDACDYTEIDPVLGTMGDFTELVTIAEEHGMKVVLDGVFNHVSDDSIYFDRYYKFIDDGLDTIGAYPYWAYVYDYMAENSVDQATAEAAAKTYFTNTYGITDYSYTEWFDVFQTTMKDDEGNEVYDTIGQRTDKPVYGYDGWWGYDSMPIIKSTNGSEYQTGDWAEEIIYNEDGTSVTQYWISQGSDGWRLDVANEVSDETWQRFRESVKSLNSEAVIIGEIWTDATKYILGDMYDSVMNYMFRSAVTSFAMGTDAETTTNNMERLRERYPEEAFYAMMNLVGSHDTTRILSYLDGIGDDRTQKDINSAFPTYENTSALAKQRQYLVSFLQFTYAGAPTIYYGDEIGMTGSDDPDDRRAFEWGKGNEELVTWYATLANIRSQYSALRTGSVESFDSGSENVLAYVRRDANDAMIVLANNSQSAQEVSFKLTDLNVTADTLTDLISGTTCTINAGVVTVSVPALSGVILTDNVKTISVNKVALAPAYDPAYIVAERSAVPPADEEVTDDNQGGNNAGNGSDNNQDGNNSGTGSDNNQGSGSDQNGSNQSSNSNQNVSGTVTIVPNDKWQNVIDKLPYIAEKGAIYINMNGQTIVSQNFLLALKGQDKTAVFMLSNGIKWSINGKTITADVNDINLGVTVNAGSIPATVLSDLAKGRDTIKLSLAHDGEFHCEAILTISIGTSYAGKYANLYYYNPQTGKMEFISSDQIGTDGYADLRFTHASDYAIVIDNAAVTGVNTGDNFNMAPIVLLMFMGLMAVAYALRKKNYIR